MSVDPLIIVIPAIAIILALIVVFFPKKEPKGDKDIPIVRRGINTLIKRGWALHTRLVDGKNVAGIIIRRPPSGEPSDYGRRDVAYEIPVKRETGLPEKPEKVYLDTLDPMSNKITPLVIADGTIVADMAMRRNIDGEIRNKDIKWFNRDMTEEEAGSIRKRLSENRGLKMRVGQIQHDLDEALDHNDRLRSDLDARGTHAKMLADRSDAMQLQLQDNEQLIQRLRIDAESGKAAKTWLEDFVASRFGPEAREAMKYLSTEPAMFYKKMEELKTKEMQEKIGATP